MKGTKLQKKIMRRIYYAYAFRLVTLPGIPQGFMTLSALIALTYFVSLGSVLRNIELVGLEGVGQLAYNAVTNTEAWTLLLIGIMVFSLLSFRIQLKSPSVPIFNRVKV